MNCPLCGSSSTKTVYHGRIRNGGLGKYTEYDVPIFQCQDCDVIWHENVLADVEAFYESPDYRNSMDEGSGEDTFYRLHDKESLAKFTYTGTSIFRNRTVADVGCGCGAFLDFVNGVARQVIAVEPSEIYRKIMDRKGFHTYPYAAAAIKDYQGQVDVVTSFDVIEHVEDPELFLREIFELLSGGGEAIIGTPTDAPIMRELLGEIYEQQQLFSTQHLWIFAEKNLRMLAARAGFSDIQVKYYQRYGIDNLLGWLRDKRPRSEISQVMVMEILDSTWRSGCSTRGMSDYIVAYLRK